MVENQWLRVCCGGQVRNLGQLDPGSLSPLSIPKGVQVWCCRLWVGVFSGFQEKFLPAAGGCSGAGGGCGDPAFMLVIRIDGS